MICGEHGQHGSLGETGLLSLVKRSSGEDPKRAYQCVKFLTQLLRSNPAAKAHILTHVTDWVGFTGPNCNLTEYRIQYCFVIKSMIHAML